MVLTIRILKHRGDLDKLTKINRCVMEVKTRKLLLESKFVLASTMAIPSKSRTFLLQDLMIVRLTVQSYLVRARAVLASKLLWLKESFCC